MFRWRSLDIRGYLPDGGHSSSATPTLTCPSSEEAEEETAANTSCFPTDRQGRRNSHILLSLYPASPSLLEVCLHLSNPHFFLAILLSGWMGFPAPSLTKETKQAGLLSIFPPCREKGVQDLQTTLFKAAKSKHSEKKVCACKYSNVQKKKKKTSILWHQCGECTGAESNKPVYFIFCQAVYTAAFRKQRCASMHACSSFTILQTESFCGGGATLAAFHTYPLSSVVHFNM